MRSVNIPDVAFYLSQHGGDEDMSVTLIGEKIAKVGAEFIYKGPSSDCRDCRLRNVCLNLVDGCRYKITRVRDVKHECKLHEGGARVVEIEPTEIPFILDSRLAIGGSTITYSPRDACLNIGCGTFKVCFPISLKNGDRYRISNVGNEIPCSEGGKLVEVKLVRLD